MIRFKNLIFLFIFLSPYFLFGQGGVDCSSVTISSATANGNYVVNSYLESDGIRDGDDYYGSTIYYPENTSGLLPSIIIIPGYAWQEISIQAWGPFLASHGIVCMTIGTNSIWDEVISESQISAIYNSGEASDLEQGPINSTYLLGWWRNGDGATYPTIPDDSANYSNAGTMTNMIAGDIKTEAPG